MHEKCTKQCLSYEEFMRRVDLVMLGLCGLTHEDLDDCPTRDWYEAGHTVDYVATSILEENEFPFDEE